MFLLSIWENWGTEILNKLPMVILWEWHRQNLYLDTLILVSWGNPLWGVIIQKCKTKPVIHHWCFIGQWCQSQILKIAHNLAIPYVSNLYSTCFWCKHTHLYLIPERCENTFLDELCSLCFNIFPCGLPSMFIPLSHIGHWKSFYSFFKTMSMQTYPTLTPRQN